MLSPNPSHNGDFTVSWNAVANANGYRLEQEKNSDGWGQVYSGSGRSWSTSGQGNGSYHYRVRACYSSTCEAWGASATETVLHPPASAPTLSAPYTATMGKEFPVSWTAVSTTTNYELEQSYAENFSGVSPVSEDSALSTYETPRTEASPYYLFYRVRACNAGGCSGWSSVGQVRVNPNLHCTGPRCHPVGGGGPLAKPAAKGSGSGGGDPAVTWNALGEAQAIVTGSTTVHLTYGPDGGLVDTSGAWGGRYFGRWLKWQSNTQWSARIIVNGQVVAVVKDSAGSVATSYLVAGPLGSTRAVANASGSLTQRIAYSAWGKFVNPDTGTGPVSAASIAATTTVTYTGHELLAAAGLINMGARLYDPATGLFMSPDPTLMQPFNTQDLNQYAYVGDNPMSFTDPSGYCDEQGQPLCKIIVGCGLECQYEHWEITQLASLMGAGWALPINTDTGLARLGNRDSDNKPKQSKQNNCGSRGKAMSPQQYEEAGKIANEARQPLPPIGGPPPGPQAANGGAALSYYVGLTSFGAGRLDAQNYGGSIPYANYAYGVYMASSGESLRAALSGANLFGKLFRSYPSNVTGKAPYNSIPQSHVDAITQGYNDEQSGTFCHQ